MILNFVMTFLQVTSYDNLLKVSQVQTGVFLWFYYGEKNQDTQKNSTCLTW